MKNILALLGVTTEDEGVAAITNYNSAVADLRAATGTATAGEAFKVSALNATVARQLASLTGKTGGEAVAVVTAWKAGAEEASEAKAELANVRKADADAKAMASLDAACADGRVRPASRAHFEALYKDFGLNAMNLALAGLGSAGPSNPSPGNGGAPPRQPEINNITLTAEDKEVARQMGHSIEQMLAFKQSAAKPVAY